MIGYIYSIINKVNGKRYIGKTINLDHRIYCHFNDLRKNEHHSHKLQRAFNKYGEENFIVEVKEYNVPLETDLYQLEIDTIKKYDSYYNGYNETLGGEGNTTIIDFDTSVLIYQIGKRYEGIINKLSRYFKCDKTTIKKVFERQSLEKVEYDLDKLNQLIKDIGITDDNLIGNYKDNYSRKLTQHQVLMILSTLEIKQYTQSSCAKALNVKKDVVNNIVAGKTYKEDYKVFKELTKEEKEMLCEEFCNMYEVQKFHYEGKRSTTKNPLTQKQVDYILDSLKENKKVKEIAERLNISSDRVSGVKNRKSYIDLIENYEKRHSS